MQRDYLGNPVSGANAATLAAIDAFIGGFLGYEERMLGILAAADADPASCLANAYAGWVWMFLESPAAPTHAAPYFERASAAAPGATARERHAAALLGAWMAEDLDGATALADLALAAAPRDLAVLKLHQYFSFIRGRFPAMLRVAQNALPAAGDVAPLHGMLAFAYGECQLLAEAEAEARTALRMQRHEPWAHHALAHVMLGGGRVREGIRFLESVAASWTGLTSFMYTHNWWHLALFLISEGRLEEALEVHDRHCWARDRSYSQDQIGAVSLLARIELAGGSVGPRWEALGEFLAARRADTVQPFLTLQYLYGLARAGRAEAGELLEAVRRRAASGDAAGREVWTDIALPAGEALIAHATGDPERARRGLGPTLGRLLEVGGSHAQRDLFGQVYLDSLVRSGRLTAAQQLLEARRAFEPDGVPLNLALARVYEGLGLPREAARAAERARRGPRPA